MFSPEDLRELADRAQRAAYLERQGSPPKSVDFDRRARAYERLADAADTINAMMARDTYHGIWGAPSACNDRVSND